jgi:hypothetical protein
MSALSLMIGNLLTPKEREATTVHIPLSGKNEYCDITYLAKNDMTKEIALQMATQGQDAVKNGRWIITDRNLRDLEKEKGLKRHDITEKSGRIIPAYQHHVYGSTFYKYWEKGVQISYSGVHGYEIYDGYQNKEHPHNLADYNGFLVEKESSKSHFLANYAVMMKRAREYEQQAQAASQTGALIYEMIG